MAKGTENFKKVIQKYLDLTAEKDELFAETLKKPGKNIDDCITYILNTVQKSGAQGFTDKEIFGLALHYYDEDNVTVGPKISGTVVVNHQIELSAEEIADAKKKALDKVFEEEKARLTAKKKVPEKKLQDIKPTALPTNDLFAGEK